VSFDSSAYLVFFVLVLAVYWTIPQRFQNYFLILASFFFYGFVHPWFLLPFFATTLIDYFVANRIECATTGRRKLVVISVCANLGLLAIFKYFHFFLENTAAVLDLLHIHVPMPVLRIILPAGISFYTFQSIGYVVDVYRGHVRACRHLRDYALFVAFFPQLVAGPIQRAGDLLAQIQRPRRLQPAAAYDAAFLLLWGFFKKLVIADNVAVIADKVFALRSPSFPILWTGVLAFAIQIYTDFSGYTDIARACARLLGFEITRNFNHPYLANSPSDFWRRWHISLSTWIRDYLYIPLGGSRISGCREILNIFIVFFLVGLWHGAAWNFVLWGVYYAVLTMLYRVAARLFPQTWSHIPGSNVLCVLVMFIFTNIGWLIFREHDIAQLGRDLILSPTAAPATDWFVARYLAAIVFLYSLPLGFHLWWDIARKNNAGAKERWLPWIALAQSGVAILLFFGILVLRSDAPGEFIYFQF